MAVNNATGYNRTTREPLDALYLNSGSVYANTASANAAININVRYTGSFVNVGSSLYWYKNGVQDTDLVPFLSQLDTGSLTATSSFNAYTASNDARVTNVYASESNYTPTSSFDSFTSSYLTDSSSFDSRIKSISGSENTYTTTQSFQAYTQSLNTYTSSVNVQLSGIYVSESNYLPTASYLINSSSFDSRITNNSASIYSVVHSSGSLATLTDVSVSGITSGQPLVYDTSTSKWKNLSYISASISGTANVAGGTAGAIPYQSAANTTTVLAANTAANHILMSGASAAPTWSVPTFPNASATVRKIIVSDGTNWTASTETYGLPGVAGTMLISDGTNWASVAMPGAGIALSTGTGWGTSITNNSTNWNTAYSWGNYAVASTYIGTTAISLSRASLAQTLTGVSIDGNAGTATALQTARTINGVYFDGTANITITSTASNALTIGTHLTGSSYNGSSPVTIATDATSANTASTIVARDITGNFSMGALTATQASLTNNTASSSYTTGTLVVTGGIGLSGALYGNSTANFATSLYTPKIALGSTGSIGSNYVVSLQEVFTVANGTAYYGFNTGTGFTKTNGIAYDKYGIGFVQHTYIQASNNSNWTFDGIHPCLTGVWSQIDTQTGGTGTIDQVAAFNGVLSFYGAHVITNAYGITFRTEKFDTANPVNVYGIYIPSITIGTTSNYAIYTAGTTPSVFGGSVTASSFIGAGTGLTGTASGLSIGGNAATASLAANSTLWNTYAVNLGVSPTSIDAFLIYNNSTSRTEAASSAQMKSTLGYYTSGDNPTFGTVNGTTFTGNAATASNVYVYTDNTSAANYPIMWASTTGTTSAVNGSPSRFYANPSTGVLTAGTFSGAFNGTTGTFSGNVTAGAISGSTGIAAINAAFFSNNNATYATISLTNSATNGYGVYSVADKNYFSGNVGVGTSSPSAKLDVVGYIRATGGSAPSAGVGTEVVYDGTNGTILAYDRTSNLWKPMQMQGLTLAFATSGVNALTINSSQDLNYGSWASLLPSHNSTYQQAKYGGIGIMWRNADDAYINSNISYNSAGQNIADYTVTDGVGRLALLGGNLQWFTYNGSVTAGSAYSITNVFSVTPAGTGTFLGNLNWGSTSGSQMKTVSGTQLFAATYTGVNYLYSGGTSFRINNQADNLSLFILTDAGAATVYGSVTATGFFESSDIRLKNIVSRHGDMIAFYWKPELKRDTFLHYGYAAQEVEKYMPNQVQTDSKGFKSVNYTEVLVYKISQLEKRILELEKITDVNNMGSSSK